MPNIDQMRAAGWGNPDSPTYEREHIITLTRGGVSLRVRSEAAPLFAALIDHLTGEGLNLTLKADDWGYANRNIRGSSDERSYHAWGLAIDLNAIDNPSQRHGEVEHMPGDAAQAARKVGAVWGGTWHDPFDPMHFEVDLSRDEALAAVARLQPVRRPQGVTPSWYRRVLSDLGKAHYLIGDDVKHVQARTAMPDAKRDSIYGPGTAAAVSDWQKRHGLKVDGVVGPITARKLG